MAGLLPIKNKGLQVDLNQLKKRHDCNGHAELWSKQYQHAIFGAHSGLEQFLVRVPDPDAASPIVELSTKEGHDVAWHSEPFNPKRGVPAKQKEQLLQALDQFQKLANGPGATSDFKTLAKSLELPDPNTAPELFRLYRDGKWFNPFAPRRLLIVWGCKGDKHILQAPMDAARALSVNSWEWLRTLWKILVWLLILLLLAGVLWLVAGGGAETQFTVTPAVVEVGDKLQAQSNYPGVVTCEGKRLSDLTASQPATLPAFETPGDKDVKFTPAASWWQWRASPKNVKITAKSGARRPDTRSEESTVLQYLEVQPRQTLLNESVVASAKKAGTVDFDGELKADIAENGTVVWGGFSKPGGYHVAWEPTDRPRLHEERILVVVTEKGKNHLKAPIANLRLNPLSVKAGQPIEANTSASMAGSRDSKTTGKIVKREIRWASDDSFTSMDKERASHVYTAKGTYAVTLRISDDQGNEPVEDTVNAYVDVPPPPATPVAGIVMKPLTDQDRQSRAATISDASSPNGGSPLTEWKLDWGDGTPAMTTKDKPAAANHQYSNDGPHTISLSVTNVDGKESKPASAAVNFSVRDVPKVQPRPNTIGKPLETSSTMPAVTEPPTTAAATRADKARIVAFEIIKSTDRVVDGGIEVVLTVRGKEDHNATFKILKWNIEGGSEQSTNSSITVIRPKGTYAATVEVEYVDAQGKKHPAICSAHVEIVETVEPVKRTGSATVKPQEAPSTN